MKQKWLIWALCLSLVFNMFVLLGFVRARTNQGARIPPPTMTDVRPAAADFGVIARELKLDEQQRAVFRSMQEERRRTSAETEQSLMLVRQSIREEISREQPDVARIRELVHEETDLLRQRRMAEATMFSRFMDELRPEQRRAFKSKMAQSAQQHERPVPRQMLEMFDHNKNGHLDADELREARQEMQRRRQQREMNRAPATDA
jgi:Spy/CpxP family protein refolding chaperone